MVSLVTVTPERIELCTASAIAPNLVLTARHCVAGTSADTARCGPGAATFAAPYPAESLWVGYEDQLGAPLVELGLLPLGGVDGFIRVSEVHVPDAEAVCDGDVALLILEEPLPDPGRVPLEPRLDQAVITGEEYTAVGFGGTPAAAERGSRRSRSGLAVQCSPVDCAGATVGAGEFVADAGVCYGDSGGPALAADDGAIIGVASRTDAECTRSVYAAAWAFRDLIRSVAERAAALGGYDPPAWVAPRPFVEAGPVEPPAATPLGGEPPLDVPPAGELPSRDPPLDVPLPEPPGDEAPVDRPEGATSEGGDLPLDGAPSRRRSSGCAVAAPPGAPGAAWLALCVMALCVMAWRTRRAVVRVRAGSSVGDARCAE